MSVESPDRERAATPLERAFYGDACECVTPANVEELRDAVRTFESEGRAMIPAGAGAHAFLGNPPGGERPVVISTARLDGVLQYDPDDFTVGVEAGCRVSTLHARLAANGQELAVDFPLPASAGSTVGGLTAAALTGPRRAACGDLRAQVLGVHGVRGGGRPYKVGGMVVKNVAGYEIAKFVCGSLGTAGVITRVNFKLRPVPEVRRGTLAVFDTREAAFELAATLRRRALEPIVLAVLDPTATARVAAAIDRDLAAWSVAWLFEGNRSLTDWLVDKADTLRPSGDERIDLRDELAATLLGALQRAYDPADRVDDRRAVVRVAMLPTRVASFVESTERILGALPAHECTIDARGGQVVLEWSDGAERLAAPLAPLTDAIASAEGRGVLLYLPVAVRRQHRWSLADDPTVAVSERVLRVFDPRGLFCPGRVL